MRTATIKVGSSHGTPRVYMDGKWVNKAGFIPGQGFDVEYQPGSITITPARVRLGRRKVAGRSDGSAVIDINSQEVANTIGKVDRVTVTARSGQIVITPALTDYRKYKRKTCLGSGKVLSQYAGGGLLCKAAEDAGLHVAAAIEINPDYAEIHAANHPDTHHFVQSVEQVPHEQVAKHGPFDLFIGGQPCEPYSKARRGKKDHPELHPLGDMTFWTLHTILMHNPHTAIIEEVPEFLSSASWAIMSAALRRADYLVDARVLSMGDYGSITQRQRAVVVATSFDTVSWPKPVPYDGLKLGQLLDPIPHNDSSWFGPEHWTARHWQEQREKGNGFISNILTEESDAVPTITKRYFAGQGANPVVKHPTRPDTYRWFTVNEVRRIMGLPDDYQLGTSKTTAGEVLGQGVEVGTFTRIIQSVMSGGR